MERSAGVSRRALLLSTGAVVWFAGGSAIASGAPNADLFPLDAVRLKPSIFLDAINANRAYLLSLEPDRLLHNFRAGAGLAPKGALYGGWEARGIAGHSLGHYLSACALIHAQTGDDAALARVDYIVSELAACQAAHGDGYVGGTTVERGGAIVDGKIVYEEVRRGEIRADGFGLNGGWVPLYAWHKVHAGLLDAHGLCGSAEALHVARGMGDYLVGVFADLDDNQVQRVLACEHGGIIETFAELYARTGEPAHLMLAERLRHRAVLDPLSAERDQLAGLHANTQIPKVIGLARLHELTAADGHARAARFFWETVTRDHSYVIGGNSDGEHFARPGIVAERLTDRTCEACNTYNMLRLTRLLWSWRPEARYFDYFERAHLNHIMAHQHPRTGMKAYFMPMTNGGRRQFSTPTSNFWCCVGTGMESHAKHGESVFGRRDDTLYVNLFIPASLRWAERGASFDLDTAFPEAETIDFTVREAGRGGRFAIAMRLPAWCAAPDLALNGRAVTFEQRDGYALVRRRWRDGDRLTLTLPMAVRAEPAPDNPNTLAFTSGPLVLAADLGEAERPIAWPAPALRRADPLAALQRVDGRAHEFQLAAHGGELTLRPFFALYERRTAPYLSQLTDANWAERVSAFAAEEARRITLDARTVDFVQLGETASEAAHNYRAHNDDLFSYEGVAARQAAWGAGNYFELDLAVEPGPLVLQALYWGEEINKDFEIKIDGALLAHERRIGPARRAFIAEDYPLAPALTRSKTKLTVRFETRSTDAMVYQLRVLRA